MTEKTEEPRKARKLSFAQLKTIRLSEIFDMAQRIYDEAARLEIIGVDEGTDLRKKGVEE